MQSSQNKKKTNSILEEAAEIISGPRRQSYGPVEKSFKEVAQIWEVVLKHPITPQDVAKCLIGLKLQRESANHSRDNLVDLAGYTALLDQLYE